MSRPLRYEKQTHVDLHPGDKRRLAARANREGIGVSELVRRLVADYLAQAETRSMPPDEPVRKAAGGGGPGRTIEDRVVVKFEAAEKRRLKVRVAQAGTDMKKLVSRLVHEYLEDEGDAAPVDPALARLSKSSTAGLTTDEIMALTRGG